MHTIEQTNQFLSECIESTEMGFTFSTVRDLMAQGFTVTFHPVSPESAHVIGKYSVSIIANREGGAFIGNGFANFLEDAMVNALREAQR